jgi:hypothetical protein
MITRRDIALTNIVKFKWGQVRNPWGNNRCLSSKNNRRWVEDGNQIGSERKHDLKLISWIGFMIFDTQVKRECLLGANIFSTKTFAQNNPLAFQDK